MLSHCTYPGKAGICILCIVNSTAGDEIIMLLDTAWVWHVASVQLPRDNKEIGKPGVNRSGLVGSTPN